MDQKATLKALFYGYVLSLAITMLKLKIGWVHLITVQNMISTLLQITLPCLLKGEFTVMYMMRLLTTGLSEQQLT
ncbi:MAG: hypothetical protein BWK80_06970 [Desulfobacteraceae bacterium IS3]|nr:MAG: hypothetical protein BWK80_06970 [Desulfobacteraceae bacterium IS3]